MQKMADAPAGIELCRLDEIDDPGARGFDLATADGPLSVIVVRLGPSVYGYVNRCPHQGTPLETFPDRFLSRDGKELICSTHGARFRAEDGYCVRGPCKGLVLQPCATFSQGGVVYLPAPRNDGQC